MGGEVAKGLLLVGPPGTGKSYLAQCIATEAGLPFGYTSASSFRGMFWGMDVLIVYFLYRKAKGLARKHGGCILFIDEIDSIGMSRFGNGTMGMGGMGMMGNGGLNQLLMEMDPPRINDGWRNNLLRRLGLLKKPAVRPNVVTMAATNIVEVLDPALLRAGRFDRKLTIDKPDEEGRKEVIEYYLAKVRHEDLPLDRMSGDTIGYTPVEIKYVINEATVVAHFSGRDAITYADFSEARESHEFGIKQPIRGLKLEEKRRLAYHEAGHAFAMAVLMKDKMRISKASIIRQGGALGMVAPKPVEERYTETKEEILAEIQVCLASRAAEELFLGTQLNGVTSDLAQATRWAMAYLGIYGMGGSLYSYLALGNFAQAGSDKWRIEQLLNEQYTRVKTLCSIHGETLHAIAQALLTHGEVIGDDIVKIVAEKERERLSQDFSMQEDARRLAYHEAGHAVAGALLDRRSELNRVSIIAATDSLGFSDRRPITKNETNSREELLSEIKIKLAGRAAEELFLGTLLDGSQGDLDAARRIGKFVIEYMSTSEKMFEFDPTYGTEQRGSQPIVMAGATPGLPVPPSPEPGPEPGPGPGGAGQQPGMLAPVVVDQEAAPAESGGRFDNQLRRELGKLLYEQYREVKQLLSENEEEVHQLARALAEKGELGADDLRRILNGKLPKRSTDVSRALADRDLQLTTTNGAAASEAQSHTPSA
jgi:ATP-dependent Zn protease